MWAHPGSPRIECAVVTLFWQNRNKLLLVFYCSTNVQDKQLTIPDDLGKDGQSVAALQRRLANFEHDLLNLGTQVGS